MAASKVVKKGSAAPKATAPSRQLPPELMAKFLDAIGDRAAIEPQPVRLQDRVLPVANVARVMSEALPAGVKISRDTKHIMQELVTEFICFVTSEVNDTCLAEGKRTINGKDAIHREHTALALSPSPHAPPCALQGRTQCSSRM